MGHYFLHRWYTFFNICPFIHTNAMTTLDIAGGVVEHTWKSLIHDGDTVSVHRPSFYASRFKNFMSERVFRNTISTWH